MRNSRKFRINWRLTIGFVILLIIMILTVWGFEWAPKDPLATEGMIKIDGEWDTPPLSPLTPGFPLGTDPAGRDILSRLLWAVKPTIILVVSVAVVRLTIGVIFGVYSGWSNRISGQAFDTIISVFQSIPVLLVSIAIVSLGKGMGIFFLALISSGWIEAAQYVRDHIKILKNQQFIETARALGANRFQIFRYHIIRHLTPLLIVLFVFEVSATLLLIAELGFLGRFIGGTTLLATGSSTRVFAEMPDLGEMLATTRNTIIEPWGMVAAGGMVFLMMLGFNLFGQGLRNRLGGGVVRRNNKTNRLIGSLKRNFEHYIFYPIEMFFIKNKRIINVALGLLLLVGVIGTYDLWSIRIRDIFQSAQDYQEEVVTEFEDMQRQAIPIDIYGEIISSFKFEEGIYGDPYIADNGRVYILSRDNAFYSFDESGNLVSQILLDPPPYFSKKHTGEVELLMFPYITPSGNILIASRESVYLLDSEGNVLWKESIESPPYFCCSGSTNDEVLFFIDQAATLYAINEETGIKWKYQPHTEFPGRTLSKPIVSTSGEIIYVLARDEKVFIHAVNSVGKNLWETQLDDTLYNPSDWLIPDYNWLLFNETNDFIAVSSHILQTSNGEIVDFDIKDVQMDEDIQAIYTSYPPKLGTYRYLPGAGNQIVLIEGRILAKVDLEKSNSNNIVTIHTSAWEWIRFDAQPDSFPPIAGIYKDGNILLQFYKYSFDVVVRKILVWGNDKNEYQIKDFSTKEHIANVDVTGEIVICFSGDEEGSIVCETFNPWIKNSKNQFQVEGIRSIHFASINYETNKLYIYSKDHTLYIVELPLP